MSDEVQRERELADAWRKAEDRADKAEAELDALRQALDRAERDRDEAERNRDDAERKVDEWRKRAWGAEGSLTIRRSLCRDIAVALGCEGLEGDAQLLTGLAAIRALKQAKDGGK